MQMDPKRLRDEVLNLPLDVRAALAADLLDSLDGFDVEAGREAAWADEIQRRLEAWERGDVKTVSHSDFVATLSKIASGSSS